MLSIGGFHWWPENSGAGISAGSKYHQTLLEYNHQTYAWAYKASLPFQNHRHCLVNEEEEGRFWMIGGHTPHVGHRAEVYYYVVASNSWHHHSNLNSASIDSACGIITSKSGNKWLLVIKGHQAHSVIYYDLTNNNGWHHVADLYGNYNQHHMKLVILHKYSALLLGSSNSHRSQSLWNFLAYNSESSRFEYVYHWLQNEMNFGNWVTLARNKFYRALENCVASRLYAAVGWGGISADSQYNTTWSVLMRIRQASGDYRKPLTCHGKIPVLEPGKQHTGVTAVDYTLYVCGGRLEDSTITSDCHFLDTNAVNPEWKDMEPMPVERAYFEFVTYAGYAFAIGGQATAGSMRRTDRWTKQDQWVKMAAYPKRVYRFCAVADDGYDRIISMGGYTDGGTVLHSMYIYKVSEDKWVAQHDLTHATRDPACGIIHRRSDGHRILYVVGTYARRSEYFDLTNYGGNGRIRTQNWVTPNHHSQMTTLVSLSPYESYEVNITLFDVL